MISLLSRSRDINNNNNNVIYVSGRSEEEGRDPITHVSCPLPPLLFFFLLCFKQKWIKLISQVIGYIARP